MSLPATENHFLICTCSFVWFSNTVITVNLLPCPRVEPGSRTSIKPSLHHSMSLTDGIISFSFFIICSLSRSSLSCFFLPALFIISVSLTLLSHCCCELPFPCAAGVVITKSKRELLRKHLWLPPSLWLRSLPIFTTGPFEVMNEKWQYSSSDLRNRLVRAIHWQLETSHKYWMQVLGCVQSSCFLFLWSNASIKGM